jgi:FkbM family methyltransferase
MNLSAISDKTLLGKILRLPLRLIPPEAALPILQGRLRGKRWIVGSSIHGCWLGSFEHAKRIVFERTVTEGSVVFDVGAHVGYYTLLASVLTGPAGKVFAFEPAPRNLGYLKRHLERNRIRNVTVIEAAVSDGPGVAPFDETDTHLTGHLSPEGALQVATVGLDDLVAQGRLPLPHFIKMDIEGGETRALRGAKTLLSQAHPAIFLSTHGRDVHEECCRFLESLGYTLEPIEGVYGDRSAEILARFAA